MTNSDNIHDVRVIVSRFVMKHFSVPFVYRGEKYGAVTRDETHVKVHPSVKVIKWKAFYKCMQLRTVIFIKGLEVIGWRAFSNCTLLKKIVIPPTIKVFEAYEFYHCS